MTTEAQSFMDLFWRYYLLACAMAVFWWVARDAVQQDLADLAEPPPTEDTTHTRRLP